MAGGFMYVIGDDEHHLACFEAQGDRAGHLIRILEGELPAGHTARKAAKPDLEALLHLPPLRGYPEGALLALGSGSRPSRRTGAALALDAAGAVAGTARRIDLAGLQASLSRHFGELNIEGGALVGDEIVLLQRASKGHALNALIRLPASLLLDAVGHGTLDCAADALTVRAVDLGAADGIPLSFTDCAALPDGRIVFTAVAEDTGDSYHDGPCAAAAIGILEGDGRLLDIAALEPACKIEGVHARVCGNAIELLLVTDADDESVPGMLLAAELS